MFIEGLRPAGGGRPLLSRQRSMPRSAARTLELVSGGFSARSGFLDSATSGGISWLAHSTLQSGLLVNSQRRYNDLVEHQPVHAQ